MNKILALVAIALITFASCGGDKKTEKETGKTDVKEVNIQKLKIAFYQQDSLISQFKFYKDQDKLITDKQLAYKNQMDKMSNDYRSFVAKNEKKAQQGLLSQQQMQSIGEQVQAKEKKIMDFERNQGKKLEAETMKSQETIGKKIDAYSKIFAEENKIDILLIQTPSGQFGHISPSMDVTKEFIEFLNAHEEEIKKDMEK